MQTYPLKSITIEEAALKQFKFVDCISQVFPGNELLSQGDLGVVPGLNKPETTDKVEKVLAKFFGTEAALLVRGAGTNAIRNALYRAIGPNKTIMIHDAPVYPTTQVSLDMLNIATIKVNFNDIEEVIKVINDKTFDGILIQLTRQKPDDAYDSEQLIQAIRKIHSEIPIVTDDNYAVMKIPKIGVEMGASLSCFSTFKLLGPEGIGCVVGKKTYIELLKKDSYSGGLQVQGHEALAVLRGLTYAPVALAISARTSQELYDRLNNGELEGIKSARIANAQSKVVLVEFEEAIAKKVLEQAKEFGAAPYPVGAESKYEIVPMFYRVSNTFLQYDLSYEEKMIRINPMRAGADTIIRILKQSIDKVEKVNNRKE